MIFINYIEKYWEKYWKLIMFIPVIMFLISAGLLINNVLTKGFIMDLSAELSGGKIISFEAGSGGIDIKGVQKALPYANIYVTKGASNVVHVEFPFEVDTNEVVTALKPFTSNINIREIGPVVSSVFFQQAQIALITAFVLMSIIVFIIFRVPAPSIAVIFAAVTDIIVTIAVLDIIGVTFSLTTLAAILMLIGYSVDTDVLLTTEVLKSGRDVKESIRRAAKTGLTLTSTALSAVLAIYFISGSFVLEQIALVLIIGLITDVFATWLTNAGILRWWVEKYAHKS